MLNQAHTSFSKMHVRRNPSLSIKSTAAYSQLSPQLQSATSGSFLSPTVASRRGLLSARSPPPSPNLPSLIPRHGKKGTRQAARHARLVKKMLLACCGVGILCWMVLRHMYHSTPHGSAGYEEDASGTDEWEMVGGNRLPHEPSAVAVQDAQGQMRWTVSIPQHWGFPLQPAQYRDICHTSMELAARLRQDAQRGKSAKAKRVLRYNQEDEYYMDVKEAEEQGLLPASKATGRPMGFVEDEGIADGIPVHGLAVCDRSLTYVMETDDAGFGNSLMRMWMSYGLAQAENRTFFIDDTRWPYGNYKSFFAPPPTAPCAPPPPSHMLPCPHTAAHLVVSGATMKQTFGHAFNDAYEDPTKMRVARQHRIFSLAHTGYKALFTLRPDDAAYAEERARHVYAAPGPSIGVHVRHGDRHPLEYQYSKDYIPLSHYADAARDLARTAGPTASARNTATKPPPTKQQQHPPAANLLLASDDPLVYLAPELHAATRAQTHIMLATKAALEAAAASPPAKPWLDEITGWEGGFYRNVFFSLGQTRGGAAHGAVSAEAMKLRELVGRAYLLDVAVLGRAESIVCGVSSTTCRILGVMLGWERGMEQGRWKNIDGGFEWRGIMW